MSFKNVPIPPAAEAAGFTRLALADDFDTLDNVDWSGEGKPGYLWYADRPFGMPTLTKEDVTITEDSVAHIAPERGSPLIALHTYSCKGDTGYTMQFGYMEARIRVKKWEGEYSKKIHGWPAFWSISKQDWLGRAFTHCGELDVLEMEVLHGDKPYYSGTLHDWHRTGEIDDKGRAVTKFGTNLVNCTGYNDYMDYLDEEWHTYAALWEKDHIAWYLDNKLMHAARYNEWDLPQYFYRDDPTPLPRIEHYRPELANRTWPGCHSIMNNDPQVVTLGCHREWPMDVDWVRIWEK